MKIASFIAGLLIFGGTAAEARDFGEVGGFAISALERPIEAKDGGYCGMMKEFAGSGSSRLMVFRFLDNADVVIATVDNYEWSITKGKEYQVKYSLGEFEYERTAVGTVDSIHKGLMAGFPATDFLTNLTKAPNLVLTMNEKTVDNLGLNNSAAAIATFNRCWEYLKADEAAKTRKRNSPSYVPIDPFK